MGGSTSRLKRWMSSGDGEVAGMQGNERAVKRLATPFVYCRRGSMYRDEDGDVAHEFYEEVPPLRRGVKATMRQILTNLTPQGDVRLPFPCLHTDFPIVLYQDSQDDPRVTQR
ncbi:tumor suppressor candidate 2-like [Eriocheir sinensis]|uniref:tumor suppressor candidate 2-like n=1 Tax=Eriocheir sinensis TaxID=95602 RepID=UPI0021CA89C7|nr:tumor suppressor candidate 2-like [Eriocheir sinensis]XP_050698634.1 tumor suppressor candidate 2-like [Eriocheir sinensis]